MRLKTHLSRTKINRFNVLDRDPPPALAAFNLPPGVASSPRCVRSPIKKVYFSLDGVFLLAAKLSDCACFSSVGAQESVSPLLGAPAQLEANFQVIFWQPGSAVGLSVLDTAPRACVCGADCAVRES